jgi:hypothetical protein
MSIATVHHASIYAKGSTGGAGPVLATGATSAGAWTPAGSRPPASFADLLANPVTPSPATNWTAGQKVTCRNGDLAHWDGTAPWNPGAHP